MPFKKNMEKPALPGVVAGIVGGLALLCWCMAALGAFQKMRLMLAGTPARGVVMAHREMAGGKSGVSKAYALTLAYPDADGQMQRYTTELYASPAWYAVGDTVPLWHLRGQVLPGHPRAWTNTVLWAVFGLLLTVVWRQRGRLRGGKRE